MNQHRPVTADRHLFIGGSDAKRIIDGNWLELYQEKVGEKEAEDLSRVFRVQLGTYTETFHLDWLAQREGWQITDRNVQFTHRKHDFLRCHIDGLIKDMGYALEVKHSNSRATAREKALYYMPQLQHTLNIRNDSKIAFSVIAGNDEPELVWVERNPEYIERMEELQASFWWHVQSKVPPEITPTGNQASIAKLGATIPIDGLRAYDMAGNNEWAANAHDFTANQEAWALFENAKKALKNLVPDDAAECSGHGITIKRDRRGSLRFS